MPKQAQPADVSDSVLQICFKLAFDRPIRAKRIKGNTATYLYVKWALSAGDFNFPYRKSM